MPPLWSSRLLSTSSSSTAPSRGPSGAAQRDHSSPQPAPEYFDPPTLNPARVVRSPSGPQPSSNRGHAHTRSVSQPLPKIFGRKKSNGNLQLHNTDVPLDDDLVPVLDETSKKSAPPRFVPLQRGKSNDEVKTTRRCMCCDSKVNVPKELQKFRCLNCLTINDLKPIEQQSDEDSNRTKAKRDGTISADVPKNVNVPFSVERTRAIIDRCLIDYLETRCRTQRNTLFTPSPSVLAIEDTNGCTSDKPSSPVKSVTGPDDPTPKSQSPPVTPGEIADLSPYAAIVNFPDLDLVRRTPDDSPRRRELPTSPSYPQTGIIPRKPVPSQPSRRPPPLPVKVEIRQPSQNLHPPGGSTPIGKSPPKSSSPIQQHAETEEQRRYERSKKIFKPLEEYLNSTFGNFQTLNTSFSTIRPSMPDRTRSEELLQTSQAESNDDQQSSHDNPLFELDAKTLLLGDIGENGSWWTGKHDRARQERALKKRKAAEGPPKMISTRSPNIDWHELNTWYGLVHSAGSGWQAKVEQLPMTEPGYSKANVEGLANRRDIEKDLHEARHHAIRALLKITENLLKRPTRPLHDPEDLRFVLILLSNPSLHPSNHGSRRPNPGPNHRSDRTIPDQSNSEKGKAPKQQSPTKAPSSESNQHAGLLKRIFGLLAHSADLCHRYLIGWFARFDEHHFIAVVDLAASFVTHRIARRAGRGHRKGRVDDGGLIPDLSGSAMSTSAQLHSAMGLSGSIKKTPDNPNAEPDWAGDWQIKAAAKFMSLLFSANNTWQGKRRDGDTSRVDSFVSASHLSPQAKARRSGQLLHTSNFYNTLLDYHDMIADYKVWESKRDKFAFCQYPLFLSMGTKIKILEYDARRQMEIKAREAYFDQVIRQRANDGNFHLRVRRECLVDDSLRQISEAVGSGQEELKKGLRVHFSGEEGVDAGGPRKEWFLMLVRDVFDPNHGLFVYDDESHTCYFNPFSFETSDQYYLVGALLGLAIYNSTILDVALPPFAFRKLLAAAPTSLTSSTNVSSLTGTKGQMTYTIADLAEFRPSLAAGLQQLLDFDGDVEATYCRDFVAPMERYGTITDVPLMPNGEHTAVTNDNRQRFVDAYVRYLLDTAVTRQFEPFKRGFFTVCAGNALSLFRAEEIELLVRGSDERLDVLSLRAVAVHENWRDPSPPHGLLPCPVDAAPVVAWFWEVFAGASPERQRALLTFITGSDRIPAVGATSLVLRIVAGGDGWGGGGAPERARYPVARTCFNMLVLWPYDSREQLEEKLWRAVEESEGFGLK